MRNTFVYGLDQVPNHWLRSAVATADLPHASKMKALHQANITAADIRDPGSPISQASEEAAIENMAQMSGRPFFGAELGVRIKPTDLSILSFILVNSTNVGASLENLERFGQITRPIDKFKIHRSEKFTDIEVRPLSSQSQKKIQYLEFAIGGAISTYRTVTGIESIPASVLMNSGRRKGQSTLKQIYGCNVRLDATSTSLRFSSEMLMIPVIGANPLLFKHLENYASILLEKSKAVQVRNLREQVSTIILQNMSNGDLTLEFAARSLGMSSRSLSRGLRDANSSYRALLSETRHKAAVDLLGERSLSLSEVALLLGYSDHASFSNAFRKMEGTSPKEARKQKFGARPQVGFQSSESN